MEQKKLIQLIDQAKSGDAEAFDELLQEAHTSVSYQCRKMLPNLQDAEDMTQEILLTVYTKLDTLQEPAAFWKWLNRITSTRCMNALTRNHVDLQFAEDEEGNSVLDQLEDQDERQIPDKALDNAETARMIDEIVSELPEAQRMTTLLYYYDEMSVKEIAQTMGVNENAVKGRLNLARKSIKAKVANYEKQGIKLYSVSVLPLLWYFLRKSAQAQASTEAAAACVAAVVGTGATAAAVTSATAAASTATTAGCALFGKIAAGVLASALSLGAIGFVVSTFTEPTVDSVPTQTSTTTLHIHSYTAVTTPPTATEHGYTTHSCLCGDSYVDSYTDPVGAAIIASGNCGTGICWSLDENGLLDISGSGVMNQFSANTGSPWSSYRAQIKKIVISQGVRNIGSYAFKDCSALTQISIPDSVIGVGLGAFYGCHALVQQEDGIYYAEKWIISCEQGVTAPAVRADSNGIAENAFSGCDSLEYIALPDGLFSIDSNAFYNCSSLQSIRIPSSIVWLGTNVFHNCSNLTGNTHENASYLGNEENPYFVLMAAESTTITACTVPVGTKYIYQAAFKNCSSLQEVVLPDSIGAIGAEAFQYCRKLTNIILPDKLVNWGTNVFYGCTGLKDVQLSSRLGYVPENAFGYCYDITEIVLPDGMLSIGPYAFHQCRGLIDIWIPASITNINNFAFSYCTSLTSIHYGGTIEQWKAIEKDNRWDSTTGTYTVYCTDGEISESS